MKNLLHLNVAACLLKLGECRKAIETCDKVCLGLGLQISKVFDSSAFCLLISIITITLFDYHIFSEPLDRLVYMQWNFTGVRCEPSTCEGSLSPWNGLSSFGRV